MENTEERLKEWVVAHVEAIKKYITHFKLQQHVEIITSS